MSVNSGPELIPIPQPTDAPDGPGAFSALMQTMIVGGAIPYDTYANMGIAEGFGYNGQLVVIYNDTIKNGVYWSNGSAWQLITGPRTTGTLTPGTNYSIGSGQLTLRGTQVTANIQIVKSSTLVVGEVAATLPVGFRPPVQLVVPAGSTNGGGQGFVMVTINTDGTIRPAFLGNAAAANFNLALPFETV